MVWDPGNFDLLAFLFLVFASGKFCTREWEC